jgi:hypothetical protein
MVDSWFRVFILFCVEKIMDWFNSNNPIEVIMVALMKSGGLIKNDIVKKLCFSANETFGFLGGKTRVTKQIKEAWTSFS